MGVPLNIDWQQILLHVLNFVILAGGLYLLLYKPVKSYMDKRAAYYRGLESDTQKKLSDAAAAKSEYEKALAGAQSEIAKKKAEAAKESQEAADRQLAQAKEQSESLLAATRASAAEERDKLLSDARVSIAQMASEAAERLLRAGVYDRFIDAAEKEQKK